MAQSTAARATTFVLREFVGELLYFPVWWYSRGLMLTATTLVNGASGIGQLRELRGYEVDVRPGRALERADEASLPERHVGDADRRGQEVLVAELTSFLKNVDRTAGEVGAGRLRAMTFAGAHGTAVVSRVNDDYSLILHVDPDAILGEVRWEAERTARALIPAVR